MDLGNLGNFPLFLFLICFCDIKKTGIIGGGRVGDDCFPLLLLLFHCVSSFWRKNKIKRNFDKREDVPVPAKVQAPKPFCLFFKPKRKEERKKEKKKSKKTAWVDGMRERLASFPKSPFLIRTVQ